MTAAKCLLLGLVGSARFCLWARARGATDQNLSDIRERTRLVLCALRHRHGIDGTTEEVTYRMDRDA